MADRTLSSINSALATLIESEVVNQINRAVVLAQILGVKPADGKNVTWDIKTGVGSTASTAPIAEGADVSTYNVDTKQPAVLSYGEYHDAFAITGRAMAAAAATGQPQALANLFVEEMGDSVERLARSLGEDVYLGDGTTDQIMGLLDATVPAIGDTGTYAGISRGSVALWKGNVVDALGAPLNVDTHMRTLSRAIKDASGEKPDLWICGTFQHDAYAATFGPQRRYMDTVRLAGRAPITLDGGNQVLEFDGVPVVEDYQCPAGYMLAINTRRVQLRQLLDVLPDVTGSMGMVQLGGTPEQQLGAGKIKMAATLHKFAKTGNKHKFGLYVYPQLQVRRPNTCGYITNLKLT